MVIQASITGSPLRLPFWHELINLDRPQLEGVVEMAISLLDAIDGDPDLEPAGDETDGDSTEDDFMDHNSSWLAYPGCPISDPGGCPLDPGEDDPGILKPIWGIDQTKGPINEVEAVAEYLEAQMIGGRA